jgi:hypothetical protein
VGVYQGGSQYPLKILRGKIKDMDLEFLVSKDEDDEDDDLNDFEDDHNDDRVD